MNYEYSFELSPGKLVYIPTPPAKKRGHAICRQVQRRWAPNQIFFHLRRRKGHVGALRQHLSSKYFARLDLEGFFPSVTRTKVVRVLKSIGFSNEKAFQVAFDSTVVEHGRKVLPYGFPQSMLLATLAFERSALGATLTHDRPQEIVATVYVDDIILSAHTEQKLIDYLPSLYDAANVSGFVFNRNKYQRPSRVVTAFNCQLEEDQTSIEPSRYQRFQEQLVGANDATSEGIYRYVDAINSQQAANLFP